MIFLSWSQLQQRQSCCCTPLVLSHHHCHPQCLHHKTLHWHQELSLPETEKQQLETMKERKQWSKIWMQWLQSINNEIYVMFMAFTVHHCLVIHVSVKYLLIKAHKINSITKSLVSEIYLICNLCLLFQLEHKKKSIHKLICCSVHVYLCQGGLVYIGCVL